MIKVSRSGPMLTLAVLLLLAAPAHAHVSISESGDFLAGLAHPIVGLDHLLALLAMGLWSAALASQVRIFTIVGIAALLIVSGVGGVAGLTMPFMETAIGLSVLIPGLMLSLAFRRLVPGMLILALFTLFHGNAHGVEAPAQVELLSYFSGFTLASITLVALGQLLGHRFRNRLPLQLAGGTLALCGAWFVLG